MSKRRPGYGHRERDNYPTPWAAVLPLLSHLKPSTRFIEPCAGEGWLVGHLKRAGHICAGAFDLPGHDARTTRYDLKAVDAFITNPPWQTRPSNILHPIIINLSDQAPAWMLIYSDWLCTSQATPLLPRLKAIADHRSAEVDCRLRIRRFRQLLLVLVRPTSRRRAVEIRA